MVRGVGNRVCFTLTYKGRRIWVYTGWTSGLFQVRMFPEWLLRCIWLEVAAFSCATSVVIWPAYIGPLKILNNLYNNHYDGYHVLFEGNIGQVKSGTLTDEGEGLLQNFVEESPDLLAWSSRIHSKWDQSTWEKVKPAKLYSYATVNLRWLLLTPDKWLITAQVSW